MNDTENEAWGFLEQEFVLKMFVLSAFSNNTIIKY